MKCEEHEWQAIEFILSTEILSPTPETPIKTETSFVGHRPWLICTKCREIKEEQVRDNELVPHRQSR